MGFEGYLPWIVCFGVDYIFQSLNVYSVFLTLIMSVDRLYAIVKPMKIKMFFLSRHPKQTVIFVYLSILVILVSECFFKLRKKLDHGLSNNCTQASKEDELEKQEAVLYFLTSLVLKILPVMISFVLNILLWFFICRYSRSSQPNRDEAANRDEVCSKSRETKIKNSYHFTLIMLNIMDLPYDCYLLYDWLIYWNTKKHADVNSPIVYIMLVLFLVGHSTNIIIYLIFHKEFRITAITLACRVGVIRLPMILFRWWLFYVFIFFS